MRRVAALLLYVSIPLLTFAQGTTTLDPLSVTSLAVSILHGGVQIGGATGFVVQKKQNYYLITNRHVVLLCALDKDTNDVGGWICADKLKILQNKSGRLGEWFWVEENLYDENRSKQWLEHPTLGASADLIALPLKLTTGVQFYPLDLELRNSALALVPGDPVNVVGFPLGQTQAGGLPIWKTGTVASDLDINYGGKPMFLVDATARAGMSGAPVYARRSGTYPTRGGGTVVGGTTKFLGVYAEQSQELELGAVWKAEVLAALYDSLP